MRNKTAIKWARNPLLAALLLVAFCIHAMIPAGFMPGPGGLILCYGHSDSDMRSMAGMDMAGMDSSSPSAPHLSHHHGGGAPEHGRSTECPFAASAASLAACLFALLLFAFALVRQSTSLPPEPIPRRSPVVPTRLPRGPPAIV